MERRNGPSILLLLGLLAGLAASTALAAEQKAGFIPTHPVDGTALLEQREVPGTIDDFNTASVRIVASPPPLQSCGEIVDARILRRG